MGRSRWTVVSNWNRLRTTPNPISNLPFGLFGCIYRVDKFARLHGIETLSKSVCVKCYDEQAERVWARGYS